MRNSPRILACLSTHIRNYGDVSCGTTRLGEPTGHIHARQGVDHEVLSTPHPLRGSGSIHSSQFRNTVLSFVLSLITASRLAGAGEDALTQGKRAFEAGNFQEAVRILRSVRSEPGQCEASFYLGVAHYRLKQLDQAIIDLQSASRCDPKNCESQIALAQVYSEKGNENLAVGALEAALRIKPDEVTALRSAAAFYLRRELHQQAIEKLERLTALDPADLRARSDLGAAYAGSGDLERAQEQFQQVLRLRSDQPSALVGLANVYLKTSRTHEAIALLSQAEKIEPQAYEVRFLLGTALANQGRSSEAVTRFQEAIGLGGKDPEIYYHLARAYRSLGREEESRQALARFTQSRSQSNAAVEASREAARLLEQARPLVEEGKLQDAIALLENANQLDPAKSAIAFSARGPLFRYSAVRSGAPTGAGSDPPRSRRVVVSLSAWGGGASRWKSGCSP